MLSALVQRLSGRTAHRVRSMFTGACIRAPTRGTF
jgi:hypothetical protein